MRIFTTVFTTEDAEDTEDIVKVTSSLILLIQTVCVFLGKSVESFSLSLFSPFYPLCPLRPLW
jgi:hypothetical protein